MSTVRLEIGSKVMVGSTISTSKKGTVRFIGETHFSPGEWIGVELNTKEGKNDGSLNDIRYFDCEPEYGIFARRTIIKLDRDDATTGTRDKLAALKEKKTAREQAAATPAPAGSAAKKAAPAAEAKPAVATRSSSRAAAATGASKITPAAAKTTVSASGLTRTASSSRVTAGTTARTTASTATKKAAVPTRASAAATSAKTAGPDQETQDDQSLPADIDEVSDDDVDDDASTIPGDPNGDVTALSKANETLKADLETVNGEIERLSAAVEELKEQKLANTEAMSQLKSECMAYKDKAEALERENSQLQSSSKEHLELSGESQEQLDELQAANKALLSAQKAEKQAWADQQKAFEARTAELEQQLQELEKAEQQKQEGEAQSWAEKQKAFEARTAELEQQLQELEKAEQQKQEGEAQSWAEKQKAFEARTAELEQQLQELEKAEQQKQEGEAQSWAEKQKAFEARTAELERQLQEQKKQAASELDRASSAYDLACEEKASQQQAIAALREERDAAHARLDGLQAEVEGSKESIAALNREKEDLVRANMQLENNSAEKSEEGASVVQSLQEKVLGLMQSVQEKDRELMASRVVASELDGTIDGLRKQLSEGATASEKLTAQLQAAETRQTELLRAHAEALSKQAADLTEELSAKHSSALAAQLATSSGQLEKREGELRAEFDATRATDTAEWEAKLAALEKREGELRAEFEAARATDTAEWEAKLAALTEAVSELRAENEQMELGLERASEALEEIRGEKGVLQGEIARRDEELAAQAAERQADKDMLASLTAAADEFEASNKQASGSNAELAAKFEALQKELIASEAARAAAESSLEQERVEAAARSGELTVAVDKATAEAEARGEKLGAMEKELEESRGKVAALQRSASQIEAELVEAHDQLAVQQRAAQQAAASQEQESSAAAALSNLEEKVRLLEDRNRAAVKTHERAMGDLRVELEAQLQSLSNDVEMLTLDKEQLAIDLEVLQEEKDLQESLNAELAEAKEAAVAEAESNRAAAAAVAAAGSGDAPSADAVQLMDENAKLKEAILKLHTQMNTEIESYKRQLKESEEILLDYGATKDFNLELEEKQLQLEEAIAELQATVEASREYESMIETLTEQNLELKGRSEELELTVADLEMAQELNEELDATQRGQLAAAQEDIDALERRLLEARDDCASLTAQRKQGDEVLGKYKKIVEDLKQNVDEKSQRLIDDSLVAINANELSREVIHLRQNNTRNAIKARALRKELSLTQIHLSGRELKYKRLELCGLHTGSGSSDEDAVGGLIKTIKGLNLGGSGASMVTGLFTRELAYSQVELTMCQAISKANLALQYQASDPASAPQEATGGDGATPSVVALQSTLQSLYNCAVIRSNIMQAVYRCMLLFGDIVYRPQGGLLSANSASDSSGAPISSAADMEELQRQEDASGASTAAIDTDKAAGVVAVHRKLDEWADVLLAAAVDGGAQQEEAIHHSGQPGMSNLAESTVNITQNHIIKQIGGLMTASAGAGAGAAIASGDGDGRQCFGIWCEYITLSFLLRFVHMHCTSCGQMLALCPVPAPSEEVDEWGDNLDSSGGVHADITHLGECLDEILNSCSSLLGSEVSAQRVATAGGDAAQTLLALRVIDRDTLEDLLGACDRMLSGTHSLALSTCSSGGDSGASGGHSGLATTNSSIASGIVRSLVQDIQNEAVRTINNVVRRISAATSLVLSAANSAMDSLASPMQSPSRSLLASGANSAGSGAVALFPDFFQEQFVWSYVHPQATVVRGGHVSIVVVLPDGSSALRALAPAFRSRSHELRRQLEACLTASEEHCALKAEHRALESEHFKATNALQVTTAKVVELSDLLSACQQRQKQLETQLGDVSRVSQSGGVVSAGTGGGVGNDALRKQLEDCKHENVVLEEAIAILERRIDSLEKDKKTGARGDKDPASGTINSSVFELISKQNRLFSRMLTKPTPALGSNGTRHPLLGASIAQLKPLAAQGQALTATDRGNTRKLFHKIRLDRVKTNMKLLALVPTSAPEQSSPSDNECVNYGKAKYAYQRSVAQTMSRVKHYQNLLRDVKPQVAVVK